MNALFVECLKNAIQELITLELDVTIFGHAVLFLFHDNTHKLSKPYLRRKVLEELPYSWALEWSRLNCFEDLIDYVLES